MNLSLANEISKFYNKIKTMRTYCFKYRISLYIILILIALN